MKDFKVIIIDDKFNSISLTVPNAAIGSQPEYPSTWFAKNSGKPKLKIPKSMRADKVAWTKMLGYALSAGPTSTMAVRFLYDFIMDNITDVLTENWASYGRTIRGAGDWVTPFSLLDVLESDQDWVAEEAGPISSDDEWRLFYLILAGYRYGLASEIIQGSYKTTVLGKINQVLREEPFHLIPDILSGDLTCCKQWYSNSDFRMIVAALDMYWTKFPESEYAKLRVCTLNSRYKDCSSLSEIRHLSSMTALSISKSFEFIFSARVRNEIIGIGKEGEESAQVDSYFPYMREMQLSRKSPYSSSVNVNLHN